ncbi:MAG: M48 family metallopeptidase [Rhodoplanes sp.]|nr:M48 family metallopeptidase [Rhodoplanes sp.]
MLRFGAGALEIVEDGVRVGTWPYADLRHRDGGAATRIGCVSAPELARLEIADPALAAAITRLAPDIDAADPRRSRLRLKIVLGSLAVAVSLVATSWILLPHLADRLVPLIPDSFEQRLGAASDNQVKSLFGAEVCGRADGVAALDALSARLAGVAGLPGPVRIAVLRSPVKNAITLPGGRIYLFDGLLQIARDPDEVAGVLAHEIGHVRARDGLRAMIQTGGSSYLLGLLFGDVTGGSAVIFATRLLVDGSHSREAERAADLDSARIMAALGRPAAPMAAFLLRVTGEGTGKQISLLLSHPLSEERLAALRALDGDRPVAGPALLDDAQWAALRGICRR